MSCPLDQSSTELEMWFINLWNHFLIPYLMGTIMAGIEVRADRGVEGFLDCVLTQSSLFPRRTQLILG